MAAIAANQLTRLIAIGFIAGAVSILIFHQGGFALLALIEGRPVNIWSTRPIPPFGVPAILNAMFWGGLWGIVMVWAMQRWRGKLPGWLIAALVAAIASTLVAWFVVAPIKGLPMAAGFNPANMWRAPLVYFVWGAGAGLIAEWLRKRM